MREIKFRIWDHNDKNFCHKKQNYGSVSISENGLIANEKTTSCLSGTGLNGRYCYVRTIYPFSPHEVTAQQFTGIKDKNGKEIFEGDILKIKGKLLGCYFNHGNKDLPAWPKSKTVEWQAKVIWEDSYACFLLEYINQPDYLGRGSFKDEMIGFAPWGEIIGNIFENPELLNK